MCALMCDFIHFYQQDKLYHKPRLVPEQLWDIIPPAGNYIKNIMKFSGYETIDSVATLKRKDELDKMFRFVRSMSEIVEDKSQIFGIFSKNPQRVMVIPGLEVCCLKSSFVCVQGV